MVGSIFTDPPLPSKSGEMKDEALLSTQDQDGDLVLLSSGSSHEECLQDAQEGVAQEEAALPPADRGAIREDLDRANEAIARGDCSDEEIFLMGYNIGRKARGLPPTDLEGMYAELKGMPI